MPPTRAPLEEPAIAEISIPRASSASRTPIWARPRAPPEPSTSATRSLRRMTGASAPGISVVVMRQGQLQQRARLLAQPPGFDDLRVRAVMQHVHQQLARRAVGHLQFVAAVGQETALLLRMPVL